jgi:glycosyltransferase involved in cell wall biosynthesis
LLRRVVITAHDVEPFVVSLSTPTISRWAYQLAHCVIAHNQISRNELVERLGVEDAKIEVVPHGNYLHVLCPLPSQNIARKRLGVSSQAKVLLFFGQIKEVKGLDILLRAMPKMLAANPDVFLLIAGKPWKTDFDAYASMIRELAIEEHCLTHIRFIPDDEVPFFYAACDLVVLPYRRIYQSGVLLMAMSYGKAVLVSDIPGMKEVIEHGGNGFLFRSGEHGHLADVAIDILTDGELRHHAGQRALALMRAQYDWYAVGQRTAESYLKALTLV